MAHHCSALIAHCIDFRIQPALQHYLSTNNLLGDCDVVSLAGGVKDLPAILQQIEISKKLHSITRVILINHTDCGAYGGSGAFASAVLEQAHHRTELNNARQKILSAHPDIEVVTFLAKVEPDTGTVSIIECVSANPPEGAE